jgi:hypothetical protein
MWSGPKEDSPVLRMMGADLRSQKRAKHLATYDRLNEAMEAAARREATDDDSPV